MQNTLLDLLGSSDGIDLEIIKPNTTPSQPISNSNNQDLLDLLGGLDTSPTIPSSGGSDSLNFIMENNNQTNPTFSNNQNSYFLAGDFLNTNNLNGKVK